MVQRFKYRHNFGSAPALLFTECHAEFAEELAEKFMLCAAGESRTKIEESLVGFPSMQYKLSEGYIVKHQEPLIEQAKIAGEDTERQLLHF